MSSDLECDRTLGVGDGTLGVGNGPLTVANCGHVIMSLLKAGQTKLISWFTDWN